MKQPVKQSAGTVSAGELLRRRGKKWLDRVEAAGKLEKHWLDDAKKAVETFTGERAPEAYGDQLATTGATDFNILYSNVETIVPAVINSAPVPDVRRRFLDDDPAARVVADILERAIRVQIDDSRLQTELEAVAQDAFLAGRGIIRMRFFSDIVQTLPTDQELEDAEDRATGETGGEAGDTNGMPQTDYLSSPDANVDEDDGAQASSAPFLGHNGGPPLERLENERIRFEAVSWIDYRHGPAKRWNERPWESFRFCIPREDEAKSFDAALISEQLSDLDASERNAKDNDLTGWEIWDKDRREVLFIDDEGVILKVVDDPLGLSEFFCATAPIQPISLNGRLMPVNPYSIYRRLALDLDDAVRRKNKLISAMKAKGWYGVSETDLQTVINLEDNEFAPIHDPEIWAQNGGIQNAIAFWPFEKFVTAIQQLDAAITTYKQWIYEITGISDIVRGASMASETATAQNIKSQWGSLRIQKMQRLMERCARDLFVMMSEVIPSKFTPQTLEEMTGIPILPQPTDTPDQIQAKANVRNLLGRRLSTYYRIDVESDSTIRADLTQQKQEVAQFLTGSAQYFQSVGPLVQQGALPAEAALEIYISSARLFKLGRNVEDTLENMVSQAKAKAQQLAANPPQQQPSPEAIKAQSDAQLAQASAANEAQKTQREQERATVELQQQEVADQRKNQTELAKTKMTNDLEWRKAILSAATQIETAKIAAATDMDSATFEAQLQRILGLDQQQHEANMAVLNSRLQPAPAPAANSNGAMPA